MTVATEGTQVLTRHVAVVRRLERTIGWLIVAGILLGLFTLAAMHTVPRTADNATALLEGDAMVHGNVLLHHWLLSLDSFWTVDALFYGLGVAVAGLNYHLLFVIPALLATCVALIAFMFVRSCSRGLNWIPGVLVVALLLALPSPVFAYFLLQGPWHVGTTIWSLAAFWLLTRRSFGWSWLAASIILALALLGDLVTLAIGVAPCMLAGLIWLLRDRAIRRGFSAISCGAAAIAFAFALRALATAVGTFAYAYRNIPLSWATTWHNVTALGNRLGAFLGFENGNFAGISNGSRLEQIPHALGALLVIFGVGTAIVRGARRSRGVELDEFEQRSRSLSDVLLMGILGSLGLFAGGSPASRIVDTTFLTPAIVFAAILTGIAVARATQRILEAEPPRTRSWMRISGAALSLVAIVGYTATFVGVLRRPVTHELPRELGTFLVAHQLTSGLGDYPTSSLVVAATSGRSKVRPLIPGGDGQLIADNRQVATDWYAGTKFNFFVYDFEHPWRDVTEATAVRTFGSYSHSYTVGPFRVLVWDHPVSVAPPVALAGSPLNIK